MTNEEFREMAKALYEPIKQLAHVMKEMDMKDSINIWLLPWSGCISVDGIGMGSLELGYDINRNEWKKTEKLKQDFFLTLNDDLPFEPERSSAA